uniref:Uncharacterized protein n=1 Tax=Timema tahoe TaxID=61484 RepID=A0A7R9IMY5_9NEOP|nr:unnamed protein product [Timema tahoe]
MGCEITTCSFVTAPLTSHSQPVPDRRKELFLFVTGQFETQRWNRSRGTLLLVSVTGCAVTGLEHPCSSSLCHMQRWNRSKVGMGCEITTCSFVTAPLTSHSQPVPDRRKELFLFVTVTCSSFHVASIVFLIALTYVFCKPASPLDVVDTCLFTCDYCFKGEVLLKCANECLEQGGEISQTWLKTCPYFGQPLYFD